MFVRAPGSAAGTRRPSVSMQVGSVVLSHVGFWSWWSGPAPRAHLVTLVSFGVLLPTSQVFFWLHRQSRVGSGVWEGRRCRSGEHARLYGQMVRVTCFRHPHAIGGNFHHMPSPESKEGLGNALFR